MSNIIFAWPTRTKEYKIFTSFLVYLFIYYVTNTELLLLLWLLRSFTILIKQLAFLYTNYIPKELKFHRSLYIQLTYHRMKTATESLL